jgi:hypothetical protein|tara:strand:- start:8913 stop:9206 length:294 start_codon:yes stop_codon:yes gene_type:complete
MEKIMSEFDFNDVVAVMCNSGEYVGKFKQEGANTITITDPRMVVSNEQGLGFAHGICVTGKADVTSVDIYKSSICFVTLVNDDLRKAYTTNTSGIIL